MGVPESLHMTDTNVLKHFLGHVTACSVYSASSKIVQALHAITFGVIDAVFGQVCMSQSCSTDVKHHAYVPFQPAPADWVGPV